MTSETPTLDEVRLWPATVPPSDAARALGVSRSQMYKLIRLGEAPVQILRLGTNTKRVVTASLVRTLEGDAP